MALCIYCGATADSSEHWLPRGLGAIKGTTTLKDRICRDCNRTLGQELDETLLRTGLVGLRRAQLGIGGRRGHASVSPYHFKAASAVHPTKVRMLAPHGEYLILAEIGPDQEHGVAGRPLRQLVFRGTGGRIECVPFAKEWGAEQVRLAMAVRQLDGAELLEVYLSNDEACDREDAPEMVALFGVLTEACGACNARIWWGKGDGALRDTEANLWISRNYLRALAKVAFHYCLWATKFRGDEQEFSPIRRFIRYDDGEWLRLIRSGGRFNYAA